jgi:cytochrome c556
MKTRLMSAAAATLLVGACAMMGDGVEGPDSAAAIAARQAAMKAIGAASAPLRSPTLDQATARSAGATINSQLKVFAANLPKGSGMESGQPTKAKAEIWTGSDGFNNALNLALGASDALSKTTADAAGIQAQARALNSACAGCHTAFRA